MANPGQESVGEFKALKPGLFMYHRAVNPMPAHMANGLYGLLLVEPESGLPKVDREFYVMMQSEFYTEGAVGKPGLQAYSSRKVAAETPEYSHWKCSEINSQSLGTQNSFFPATETKKDT